MLPQPATSSFGSAILACAFELRALRFQLAEPSGLQRRRGAAAQRPEAARKLTTFTVAERRRAGSQGLAAANAHLRQRRLEAGKGGAEDASATVEFAGFTEFLEHLRVAAHQRGVAVAANAQGALPFPRHRVAGSGDDAIGQRVARPVAIPVMPGPSAGPHGQSVKIEDQIWIAGVDSEVAAAVEMRRCARVIAEHGLSSRDLDATHVI